MDHSATLRWAKELWRNANPPDTLQPNFLEFCYQVAQICKGLELPPREQLEALKALQDDYDRIVAADPMMLYEPAHAVALGFHKSPSKVRYNRSANRTSKTQTGYAEHYLALTQDYRWRRYYSPAKTFIVGINFSQYRPNVFERKMLNGEPGNTLSPMFPEGGKWFNHWNARENRITIACKECAEANKALRCKHQKGDITLYSDESGWKVIQGAQFVLGHFDEHVDETFFSETIERLKTVPNACLIVTGTPLLGHASWEYQRLEKPAARKEMFPGTNVPLVEIFSIDQYAAGLVKKEEIDLSRTLMNNPLEEEARIFGRPAPLAKNSVFDPWALQAMEKNAVEPAEFRIEGGLVLNKSTGLTVIVPNARLLEGGPLRVWEKPQPNHKYIIGADISAGLANRDYSCASVLEFPSLKLVAQLHGRVNPNVYGDMLVQLGVLYNMALLVPERTGMGVGTITRLKELGYWNLFRDLTDPSQFGFTLDPVFGVDTNARTKSYMIASLQKLVKERQIFIPCLQTIMEMRAFGQSYTEKGNVTFQGEGEHDDRVMSLVFAAHVALVYPLLVDGHYKAQPQTAEESAQERYWDDLHKQIAKEARQGVESDA